MNFYKISKKDRSLPVLVNRSEIRDPTTLIAVKSAIQTVKVIEIRSLKTRVIVIETKDLKPVDPGAAIPVG